MKKINVLSLFDGMSCGQQALDRAGIEVENYFASEIDKYAIQVTMANYPNTKQLGSVININGYDLPKIDLLIGGSPCQSFSFAGKRKGMSTKDSQEILTLEHYIELKEEGFEFEGQSYLFWEYMRILNEIKPKYFLLENVMMGKKWQSILTKAIGVEPIVINSSLLSAQNRRRLYWTNIGLEPSGIFGDFKSIIEQPKDKEILLKDILEDEVDEKYFIDTENNKRLKQLLNTNNNIKEKNLLDSYNQSIHADKSITISTRVSASNLTHIVHNMMPRSSKSGKGGTGHLTRNDGKTYCLDTGSTNAVEIIGLNKNQLKKFNPNINADKANTLKLAQGRSGSSSEYMDSVSKIAKITSKIRKLTPVECERLQTVPDNYTNYVSNSQRYKMLGNGWTVDVISHIFKYLKKTL
jgi:DNA (cytosine-5)-methyltransferase 3A